VSACPRTGKIAPPTETTVSLGPDGFADEFTMQVLSCAGCTFVCAGYEEGRRGSRDRWHHDGYEIAVVRGAWDVSQYAQPRVPVRCA
jgi:hypothetical protein